jgi:hypothetical protein
MAHGWLLPVARPPFGSSIMIFARIAVAAAVSTVFIAHAASMAAPDLPAAVAAPAGHQSVMTLKGVGTITYECRNKAGAEGAQEWVFVAPDAVLQDTNGRTVGKYYGGPTWEHSQGSKVTGKQVAVAPAGAGSIPFQLVQTAPAMGSGPFNGVTYIQRVNTMGGVAPSIPCTAATIGTRQTVGYSADYVFFKQM